MSSIVHAKFTRVGAHWAKISPYGIQGWALVCKTMVWYVLFPQNGQTALMLAGDSGHTDVVQLLLSSGAKVDLQNKVRYNIN